MTVVPFPKVMRHCLAETPQLDCGCCDPVRLGCTLAEGHDGPHLDAIDGISVAWQPTPDPAPLREDDLS
jgi:hypothetical protein